MPWDRRLDLHLDVDAPSTRNLLVSAVDSSMLNTPPELVAGDKLDVRLHFYRRGTLPGSLEPIDPGTGSTITLSGRPEGVPAGTPRLFLSTGFTQLEPGIWQSPLDLATAELAAHIAATPAGSKPVTCEIAITTGGGASRRSIQFSARTLPGVHFPETASPTALPSPEDWLAANLIGTRYPAPFAPAEARAMGELYITSTPVEAPVLYQAPGLFNGRPHYTGDGFPLESTASVWNIVWQDSQWLLRNEYHPCYWKSLSDTATPDLATGWTGHEGAAGTLDAIALTAGAAVQSIAHPPIRGNGREMWFRIGPSWYRVAHDPGLITGP